MTDGAGALLIATVAIAVVDWVAVGRNIRRLEYLAKPATMVALLAAAVALDPADSTARAWFVVALACSLAGDVFLMLPQDRFVPGLASFLLGHVAYIVGLGYLGTSGVGLAFGLVIVLAALPLLGRRIIGAIRSGDEADLVLPVSVYIAVISAMVVSAGATGEPIALAGALSFYASDALIAWTRFVRELPWGRVGVIVTYHLGQLGLVAALL